MSSSCRCTVPAREGERKKNRKITLAICLKLCNSREEERVDSLKQKYIFWLERNKCLLPPSTITSSGSSAVTSTSPGLHPCARLPPQGRRCLPKVLLPWEPPASLAPPPNANPSLAAVHQATQEWHTGFPTLQGWLLFSAEKMGFKQFPPASP